MTPYVIILLCLPFWQWRLSGKKGWKAFNLPVYRLFKVFLYNTLPFAPKL